MRDRVRRVVFAAMTFSSATIASLIGVEIVMRVSGLSFGSLHLDGHPVVHHVQPAGYEFLVDDPNREFGGHRVVYDRYGLRVRERGARFDDSPLKPNVVFLGDSFVAAREVGFDDSFVGRFADAFADQVDVFNFGVPGYSPILSRLQLEMLASEIEPDVVIHLLYANDVRNDDSYYARAEVGEDGVVKRVPGPPKHWVKRALRGSYVLRAVRQAQKTMAFHAGVDSGNGVASVGDTLVEDAEVSDLTAAEITRIHDWLSARGAEYHLMCTPSKHRFSRARDYRQRFCRGVAEIAESRGIPYIDLTAVFAGAPRATPFFPVDIHLNEDGHRLVFQALQTAFNNHDFARTSRLASDRRAGARTQARP